jgi:signal transduction histidine kinase/ActR/RegA family two-component response regulator
MQAVAISMVVLMGVTIFPWPLVLGWAAMAIAADVGADRAQRVALGGGGSAAAARMCVPALRLLTSTSFAIAVFALFLRGGPNERLFAYAIMTSSMVFVLMRYYRSPLIFMLSMSPYVLVLLAVGVALARVAWASGQPLGAVCASFPLVIFGTLFWSARAQLAASWTELITARQGAEEREHAAQAANRAKSNFLATMSHELRTPLNGVLGMVQALTTERLTTAQRERVKVIRRSSESLLAVLNDLLDLSKIEASALELELAAFDLEHLVRGVVAAYQPLADKKGVAFNFDIDADACGRYEGDSARIRRILYSLADNAVKFTATGAVTLSVAHEGEAVVFRVTDTGIGIEKDDLEHLFEGFFQVDGGRTRRYGGAGLGLAICHEMSRLMGGAIEAISEPRQGSTFVLRLPLATAAPQAYAGRPEGAARRFGAAGELRVLAAEDNETNQLVLKTLLSQAGIEATLVENGRQALEAWETQDWDVILMDIQMPIMDGVAATQAIRQRELETGRARTPIIAVTANAMTHQVAEYLAVGMDSMVPKPIDIAALFAAMEQALEPSYADEPAQAAVAG